MVKATRLNFTTRVLGLVLSAEAIPKESGTTLYRTMKRISKTGKQLKTIAKKLLFCSSKAKVFVILGGETPSSIE